MLSELGLLGLVCLFYLETLLESEKISQPSWAISVVSQNLRKEISLAKPSCAQ
jgi:hypothetical protein